MRKWLLSLAFVASLAFPSRGYGQGKFATEEHFHDLFITAGYSTAFGAALGAAFLGLQDDPMAHLRYIAIGASMGFIGGSVLGTYVLFAPALTIGATDPQKVQFLEATSLAGAPAAAGSRLTLRPTWNQATKSWQSLEANWVMRHF